MGPMHFLTEEEKQNMPKVTKELLARIMSYLKPYWLQFIFVFIAILLSATVGLFHRSSPAASWMKRLSARIWSSSYSSCSWRLRR